MGPILGLFLLSLAVSAHGNVLRINKCEEIGTVQFVQIFEVGPSLVVVWQAPENSEECNIKYKVEFVNHEDSKSDVTEDLHYTFDYKAYPCIAGVVTITPISAEGLEGVSYSGEYDTGIGGITDVELSQTESAILASWKAPSDSELCHFTYTVTVTHNQHETTAEVPETSFQLNIEDLNVNPCDEVELKILPVSNGKQGKVFTKVQEIATGPVKNFLLNSVSGQVVTQFDPPVNSDQCSLTYEVVETQAKCFTKNVVVVPKSSSGVLGASVGDDVETEIDEVENLKVKLESKTLKVTWEKPENVGECPVTYLVEYNNHESVEQVPSSTTAIDIPIDPKPCFVGTVKVWPISEMDKRGIVSQASYEEGIGAVLELSIEVIEDKVVTTWTAPDNSDLCELSYLVEYSDTYETHISVTDAPTLSFDYQPCRVYTISVTPHTSSGLVGEIATKTYQAQCNGRKAGE